MDFRAYPKIDLHLHLDGAVRTRTILEQAERLRVRLPARTVHGLEKHVTVGRDCRSLRDFLDRFDVFLPALRSAESMERIAYELCEDQARDGVVYFETRFAPLLQDSGAFAMEDSVEAALSGLRRGERDFGVRWGMILCCLRQENPRLSLNTVGVARAFRTRGVVGVDLAGDEAAPASSHAEAFRRARRADLPITIHAGEAGPAENIREAIEVLGASRIGHGTKLADDPRLVEEVARRGIAIEVCLTSNLQTRSVSSLSRHPFARLRKAGVRVTINTDDPAISRTTLSREYARAAKTFGLTRRDFGELYENSVRAAFVSEPMRRWLRYRASTKSTTLRTSSQSPV